MANRLIPVLALALPLAGHINITTKLTWTREISRIVHKRCASCHRDGGAAPMSLLTYEEARPWAKAIKEEVLERRMPPWGAVKGFGDFKDDQGLTQEELHLIADWVEGGAPKGDDRYLPDLPGEPWVEPERDRPGFTVTSTTTLKRAATVEAVAPVDVAKGATLRLLAALPDGAIQPLLWLYEYDPRWQRVYEFREPVQLPRGTRLLVTPSGVGSVRVLTAAPSPER
jgi:hypothetical protein